MDEQTFLNLFRKCGHEYKTIAPGSWAVSPQYMTVTCPRLAGDAKANGCAVPDCPHASPKPKENG